MKRRVLLGVLILVLLVLAAGGAYISEFTHPDAPACPEVSKMPQVSDNRLRRILEDYSARYRGIGLQATIILPDGKVWTESSGFADLRTRCPMTAAHHLFIGSITKLFTAALVMQEVERGVISLDDPISRWIVLPHAQDISVRMLLSHRSGLPDYAWDPWFDLRYILEPRKAWSGHELLNVLRGKSIIFEPGTGYQYSNSNYLLLGLILEKVSGEAYGTLLEERVREIGLTDTFFVDSPPNAFIASGYDRQLLHLGMLNVTGLRASAISGAYSAGGILSTSADVARFAYSLFMGEILNDRTLLQMEAFGESADESVPQQTGYGLGVRRLRVGSEELVGHTGTVLGYSGVVVHNDKRSYTVAVLSNLSSIDHISLLQELLNIILENCQQ